ncbi:MAG TPA: hypothetical protein VM222_01325 [Planctomycetota bacterium]|nr:hypothetical protein [Planctomycetota bacterium]
MNRTMAATYSFTAHKKDGYLHIVVRGTNDAATIRRYIQDGLAAAIDHSCPNLLIEEDLEGPRLSMGDIFQIVSEACRSAGTNVQRVAFVDVNPTHSLANMKFAETVALNRGMGMNVFPNVPEAESWLRSETGAQKGA